MDPFDIEKFRAPPHATLKGTRKAEVPRRRSGEWYLGCRIPGRWVESAARLSGRSFVVGVALWHLSKMRKTPTVKITKHLRERFHLTPKTLQRGLAALESAGLVSVDRHRGRCPIVTILEIPPDE